MVLTRSSQPPLLRQDNALLDEQGVGNRFFVDAVAAKMKEGESESPVGCAALAHSPRAKITRSSQPPLMTWEDLDDAVLDKKPGSGNRFSVDQRLKLRHANVCFRGRAFKGQKRRYGLRTGISPGLGLGLFALSAIPKGAFLCRFGGKRVTLMKPPKGDSVMMRRPNKAKGLKGEFFKVSAPSPLAASIAMVLALLRAFARG